MTIETAIVYIPRKLCWKSRFTTTNKITIREKKTTIHIPRENKKKGHL